MFSKELNVNTVIAKPNNLAELVLKAQENELLEMIKKQDMPIETDLPIIENRKRGDEIMRF